MRRMQGAWVPTSMPQMEAEDLCSLRQSDRERNANREPYDNRMRHETHETPRPHQPHREEDNRGNKRSKNEKGVVLGRCPMTMHDRCDGRDKRSRRTVDLVLRTAKESSDNSSDGPRENTLLGTKPRRHG